MHVPALQTVRFLCTCHVDPLVLSDGPGARQRSQLGQPQPQWLQPRGETRFAKQRVEQVMHGTGQLRSKSDWIQHTHDVAASAGIVHDINLAIMHMYP